MRVRNRIKKMVAVENRYFNRLGAISVLTGITVALLSFNVAFNAYYCFTMLRTDNNLMFFRFAVYLLAGYLVLYIAFRILMRYIGVNYALSMCLSSVSYLANACSGYMLIRAVFCWDLSVVIESPLGYEPILLGIYSEVLRYIIYILLFYTLVLIIPSWMQRPFFFGRLWFLNILSPLLLPPALLYVSVFLDEEIRVEYASQTARIYLTLMGFLALRFFFKTICYFLLLPANRRIKVVDIPHRRAKKSEKGGKRIFSMQKDEVVPPSGVILPVDVSEDINKSVTEKEPIETIPALSEKPEDRSIKAAYVFEVTETENQTREYTEEKIITSEDIPVRAEQKTEPEDLDPVVKKAVKDTKTSDEPAPEKTATVPKPILRHKYKINQEE